ncbi:hypothetical protein [Streptomyces sp. NPDC014793]|uniref:hypothetical protein n=1 Tax=Streptomyces sp. NPDC014793 TaxID=3364914 RepID=UPI0036FFD5F2
MTAPAPLPARLANRLITALRHSQALDEAAAEQGIDLRAVWVRARTATRLAIALACRDPDTHTERGHALRANYLRLLALGLPPSRAELILGTGDPGAWRGDDPAYAAACDAVSAASAPYGSLKPMRLTPERDARFLEELRTPGTTVLAAAAAVGVLRRRDLPAAHPGQRVRIRHGRRPRRGEAGDVMR